jgi:cell division septum initiation protein DivIVA
MSNETEILPNLLRDESFEIVMRGYNRRQVDDALARSQTQIRDLETRLARSLDDVERTRREMAEVRDARKPTGDDLSDRLRQIINLAEDEAREKLSEAEDRGNQIRRDADAEAKRIVDDARHHADKDLAGAQEKANHVLGAAKKESENVLSLAKQEAEHTVTSARLEAERTLTAAERRSSVINEGATARLTQLTKNHTQALQRLTDISETLNTLLTGEADAGPLGKMVDDAVARQTAQRKHAAPSGTAAKAPTHGVPAQVAKPAPAAAPPQFPRPAAPAPVTPAPVASYGGTDTQTDTQTGTGKPTALPESAEPKPAAPAPTTSENEPGRQLHNPPAPRQAEPGIPS